MDIVKSAIIEVLPTISADEASSVAEQLIDNIGVESFDDLQFVEPTDLSMLKPIQSRKLIQAWKKETVKASGLDSPGPSAMQNASPSSSCMSSPGRESSSTSSRASSPCSDVHISLVSQANWPREYVVPWERMSKTLLTTLKNGARPKPSQRREMVRILIEDVHKITLKPSRKQLARIAEKIALQYPKSFKDVVGEDVVGTGYDSLLKNLVDRSQNQNRGNRDAPKRPASPLPVDAHEQKMKSALKKKDSYGCVNFSPQELPSGETEETLKLKQESMKAAFQTGKWDSTSVENFKTTYYLQRRDITSEGLSIPELQKEWPMLFEVEGLPLHFKELVGVDMKETLDNSYKTKGQKIMSFMENVGQQEVAKVIRQIEKAKGEVGNDTPVIPGLVLLLMKYFGENPESLFSTLEPTATKGDAEMIIGLPQTPVLISCGGILVAKRWMLAIDGHVVNDNIPNFQIGLLMLFGAYYSFGIQYSTAAAATMDFIQRCFLLINPDRGTKVEQKKNKKKYNINPKVLSLINSMSDFEWTS